jgi:carboxyl-terminal processing protease
MRKRIFFLIWVVIGAVFLYTLFLEKLNTENICAQEQPYSELRTFTEALSIVKKNYVEEIDDHELIYGAIKGMLNSLDPHSSFMTPEMYKEMQIDTSGEFGGLGIRIGIKDGVLTIIAPIEDTPAFKAGVKAGDKIIKIEGESTKNMSLHDAVTRLRGPKGTSVTITIFREGYEKTIDFTIVRDIIQIQSVKSRVIDDKIGYVKLIQFQEKTSQDLAEHLKEFNNKGIDSLILDLRNNPGGLLTSSVEVAGQFLSSGKTIVSIKGRDGEKITYKAKSKFENYDYPMMVVLVNEGSASASEIVAGALRDWNKAVIMGKKTFGKGSVQTVIPLSDGSGLRLTTARYYTPKDISIQSKGIIPDIEVDQKVDENGATLTVQREKDLKKHLENDQQEDRDVITDEQEEESNKEIIHLTLPESDEEDNQLQRALDLIKTWRIFNELPHAS